MLTYNKILSTNNHYKKNEDSMKKILFILFLSFTTFVFANDNTEKVYHETTGIYCEYQLKNNIRHGIAKCYYKSGALFSEFTYKNGKPEGAGKIYYENEN